MDVKVFLSSPSELDQEEKQYIIDQLRGELSHALREKLGINIVVEEYQSWGQDSVSRERDRYLPKIKNSDLFINFWKTEYGNVESESGHSHPHVELLGALEYERDENSPLKRCLFYFNNDPKIKDRVDPQIIRLKKWLRTEKQRLGVQYYREYTNKYHLYSQIQVEIIKFIIDHYKKQIVESLGGYPK